MKCYFLENKKNLAIKHIIKNLWRLNPDSVNALKERMDAMLE